MSACIHTCIIVAPIFKYYGRNKCQGHSNGDFIICLAEGKIEGCFIDFPHNSKVSGRAVISTAALVSDDSCVGEIPCSNILECIKNILKKNWWSHEPDIQISKTIELYIVTRTEQLQQLLGYVKDHHVLQWRKYL